MFFYNELKLYRTYIIRGLPSGAHKGQQVMQLHGWSKAGGRL